MTAEHPNPRPSRAAGPEVDVPPPSLRAEHIPLSMRVMMALAEANEQQIGNQWREYLRTYPTKGEEI